MHQPVWICREKLERSCIRKNNVGQVELATMSFGQSFQVTPMQMAATVSSLINGGTRITPHFGVEVTRFGGKE